MFLPWILVLWFGFSSKDIFSLSVNLSLPCYDFLQHFMLLDQEEFQGILSTGHHIAITMIFTKDLAGYVIPYLLKILKDLPSPWQQTFNFLLQLRTSYFCLPSPISSQVILKFIYSLPAHISPILSLSSWHQASCIPVSLTKATTSHLRHYCHLLVLTTASLGKFPSVPGSADIITCNYLDVSKCAIPHTSQHLPCSCWCVALPAVWSSSLLAHRLAAVRLSPCSAS